jgi:NAD(P)-dependent dehydrogenase (short-subunit alcohol dehydrogenase family)
MLRAGMAGYAGSKAALEAHTAVLAGDLAGTGVTANVLIPGGAANTPMVPLESGVDRAQLIQPEAMVAPALWLASTESDGVTAKRFIAAYWDTTLPASAAVANAIAPIGWSGLGEQTIFPANYVQAR